MGIVTLMTKLREYLERTGMTQAAFAERVNLNQGTVSKLCRRSTGISLAVAARIERATDGEVPVASWFKEDAA